MSATAMPNPTKGNVNIGVNELYNDATVMVYDMLGNTLQKHLLRHDDGENVNITLPFEGLKAGIYMVVINDGQQRSVLRIVRE
jgi:hypothetical protein